MKKLISKIKFPMPGLKIPGLGFATELGESLFSAVTGTLDSGVGLLKSTLGSIPFFGKTSVSDSYDHEKTDERHYFLIPHTNDPEKFSFHITRCLPKGVPPINDLDKRRLLHLPSEHALPMLENLLMNEREESIRADVSEPGRILKSVGGLLDEVDKHDEKAFKGLLLVGGLVALVNPLAGAAVAANAAIPSIAMVLSKYGLKLADQKRTNMEIARNIKRAEKDLQKQFKESSTSMVINPLLTNLGEDISLESWLIETQKYVFQCEDLEFSKADLIRFMDLTKDAIEDTSGQPLNPSYFNAVREKVLWGDP